MLHPRRGASKALRSNLRVEREVARPDRVTEENEHLLPEKDLDEWEAAIAEYEAQQGDDELPQGRRE